MTDSERLTMANLIHYAEWCERFWRSLRDKPTQAILDINAEIAKAKAMVEVESDDL